ncbi:putative membrane protein [Pseudoduganella flava]|nr:putative membrane protein [Pseudoduganella flava]
MPNDDLSTTDPEGALPDAVNENLETISEFYARHKHEISPMQTLIERVALFFGRPGYLIGIVVFAVLWIGANLFAEQLGWDVFDEPPFFWLQGIITLNAFLTTTTVLIRQNRMARLADQHTHLDLQVSLLTDKKTSKIISLLEELRRDMPQVADKSDPEAQQLDKPANPNAVLGAIENQDREKC